MTHWKDSVSCTAKGSLVWDCLAGPGAHYCENVGRAHRSNYVYFVVSLRNAHAQYAQKCHDPDCAALPVGVDAAAARAARSCSHSLRLHEPRLGNAARTGGRHAEADKPGWLLLMLRRSVRSVGGSPT